MFFKKHKKRNSIIIQTNKLILLGCPCLTLSDGTCENACRKVNTENIPCVDCPISSLVYIAIGIRNALDSNLMIIANMSKPIQLIINEE